MNIFSIIPQPVTRAIGRGTLFVSAHAPEIMMGAGIVSGVAATVLACKATLKVDSVKCDTQAVFLKIGNARYNAEHGQLAPGETYTEEDSKRDMAVAYFQGAWAIARLYAPAIGLGLVSIGLITQSHRILRARNATLLAAYQALEVTFNKYRKYAGEKYGVEAIPVVEEVIDEAAADERAEGVQGSKQPNTRLSTVSPYAAMFDEHSRQWMNSHTGNMYFLKSQEVYLNDMLKSRGNVFLNEAYDALGLPRTQAGCFTGWIYDEHAGKDNYVRIGWNDPINQNNNGPDMPNPPFVLDFNVDGDIAFRLN